MLNHEVVRTEEGSRTSGRNLPRYAELPLSPEGVRVAWGTFAARDELGTVNRLDRAATLQGLAAAVEGRVVSLNWDATLPDPHPWRTTPRRVHHAGSPYTRDDVLAHLHLQFSTQWDGLRHVGLPSGFYNATPATEVDDPDSDVLGIHRWADHGLVGRGVLLDVAAAAADGHPFDPMERHVITVDDLERTARRHGVALAPGDVLLVRTGWIEAYERLDAAGRQSLDRDMASAGLEGSERTAEWLWDHGVAAVAADNMAVEAMPFRPGFPAGSLHALLLPALGMPLGELFRLADLASICARNGRYTFLFAAVPLNVRGAVGSPGNALAIT